MGSKKKLKVGRRLKVFLWLFTAIFVSGPSDGLARVFDLKSESFATYLHLSGTTPSIGQNAFNLSSGSSTVFTNQAEYSWGGELGVLFTSAKFGFRVGIEAVQPHLLSGIQGANAAGSGLMSLTSAVTSYMPSGYIEMALHQSGNTRWSLEIGGGYATTTINNSYVLTAAGQGLYGTVPQTFVEEGRAYSLMGNIGTYYEFSLSDNVTMMFDLGYRYLYVSGFTHTRDATTFLGVVHSGDPMRNSDGTNRSVNLGGPWAGLGLRFYISL